MDKLCVVCNQPAVGLSVPYDFNVPDSTRPTLSTGERMFTWAVNWFEVTSAETPYFVNDFCSIECLTEQITKDSRHAYKTAALRWQ
jgi:hypothetical protein